jgi:hypothetical protein
MTSRSIKVCYKDKEYGSIAKYCRETSAWNYNNLQKRQKISRAKANGKTEFDYQKRHFVLLGDGNIIISDDMSHWA